MGGRLLTSLSLGLVAAGAYNLRAWRRGVGSSLRGREAATQSNWRREPRVSALVAAWNEAAIVGRHIQSFKHLPYANKQLIIAAGGQDGSYEIAARFADTDVVVLEQLPGEGKQRSLQRCFEVSDGEIIMLTDADCLFTEPAFRRLLGPIVRRLADVTSGFGDPLPDQRESTFVRSQWLLALGSQAPVQRPRGLLGANCALRRTVVERLEPFSVPAPTGTDYVLERIVIGAGYAILTVPASRIEVRYSSSLGSYLHSWRRWIKNILVLGPRFQDWRGTGATIVAVALAGVTVLPALLVPLAGVGILVVPLTSLAIATLNRVRRIALGARLLQANVPWASLALAPFFAVVDQVAVLLAAGDTLSRAGRRRW